MCRRTPHRAIACGSNSSPRGRRAATLDLPWPVPAGTWDPREPGPNGERAGWRVPEAWLDEPILVDDPGTQTELLVDKGPARSVVHRQSLRLPPLFAPGTLTARIAPVGSAPGGTPEIPVRSGLLAGPSLAFLNDRISLRAALAREGGGIASPPDKIKVRVDPPSGQGRTYTLSREARATGYASYILKPEESPRALAPGDYKVTPATGDPALDEALGGEVVVLAALEKDDTALRRERVAFLGATPIHWPLIVWLDSGRKDGSAHRAETQRAMFLKSDRGPEEIGGLSLRLSQISVPTRQRPHDNEKDGEIRFSGPGKAPQGPWTVDQSGDLARPHRRHRRRDAEAGRARERPARADRALHHRGGRPGQGEDRPDLPRAVFLQDRRAVGVLPGMGLAAGPDPAGIAPLVVHPPGRRREEAGIEGGGRPPRHSDPTGWLPGRQGTLRPGLGRAREGVRTGGFARAPPAGTAQGSRPAPRRRKASAPVTGRVDRRRTPSEMRR